ncbi:MAG: tRNA 5-methoxyuridine(34)/uridine 5-oxyacetic acid(34) synthase CmoB [Cardiobacteriaceae bacterium]|nr:tRNA 5-methoxyuridine(34)/uridine 5-oxyacetic acid(34) synthase CmoB [Cardiobacteriaceae bacterium]
MNVALHEWQRLLSRKPDVQRLDEAAQAALAGAYALRHGHFDEWLAGVQALPQVAGEGDFTGDAVMFQGALDADAQRDLEAGLRGLSPWRKGPFCLHGVYVDSEWRSDFKFARLLASGADLSGQVLDVGTGNGYFLYRLLGAGARLAVGLDPSWHGFAQYLALSRIMGETASVYLPATLDTLPLTGFDTTLSMGVLYHRREPLLHLAQLRETLRLGGTLVLETLVVEGDERTVLVPRERYAGMRNVWFLPSVAALEVWLARSGFVDIAVASVVPTTAEEQRATAWMDRQSLTDFMEDGFAATREGLPPPLRAMLVARRAKSA